MKTGLLLSGGMDSLCIAWWKRPDVAITIDYGQLPAEAEIGAANAICKQLGIEHHVLSIDCHSLGSGDMAGTDASVHAPATDWWPYRNQLLVTLAAMKCISLDVSLLMIGTVKSDSSHLDGTPSFIAAISKVLALQEGGLQVQAPAINMTTAELVRESGVHAGALAWAHSCHKAVVACGSCRGCTKYFEVLQEIDHVID